MAQVLHVQRRDHEHIGRRMMRLELPARRSRGRPKKRFMNVVKEDVKLVGVTEKDAEDRVRWRQMILCGETLKRTAESKEKDTFWSCDQMHLLHVLF